MNTTQSTALQKGIVDSSPSTCIFCKAVDVEFKMTGKTLIKGLLKPYAICATCYNKRVPPGIGVAEKIADARKKMMRRVMSLVSKQTKRPS